MTRSWAESNRVAERLAAVVPGGAHTYAKGPDQYPEGIAPVIARGLGAHVWDVDGNEYVEFGSGLRSVALGHAHPVVNAAVRESLQIGMNFARPSALELDAAEALLAEIPGADMVKFAKNGSDATTAAVRLARAVTGRDLVAVCADQPFFSTDDWFIGVTDMPSGIPGTIRDLTVTFPYGDLAAVRSLFEQHPDRIAGVVLQTSTMADPPDGYLTGLLELCEERGALLIFDEMINGFRIDIGGGQRKYGVSPHLSTFGKAMGNGFAVSALAGRRELMELGGLNTKRERVFVLSTTHGAETVGLTAMMAVAEVYRREGIVERLADVGGRLKASVEQVIGAAGLAYHIPMLGHPANLVFGTRDVEGRPSQGLRTVFMEQLLRHGVLAPSFVVSAALSDTDIELTVDAVEAACAVYGEALDDGWEHHTGRSVKPALRRYA